MLALSVLSLGACERSAAAGGEGEGSTSADAETAFADPLAPTLEELRAAHPRSTGEGDACTQDDACVAPLRCVDAACAWPGAMTGQEASDTPFVIVTGAHGESRYYLELAVRSSEQARGLMHRDILVPDWGMLFVFPSDRQRSFWMRNTLIPLDMVFIRSDGVIDSFQENAEPLTETSRPSEGPARYVLELNAGEVARLGLGAGARVEFVNLAPELSPAP